MSNDLLLRRRMLMQAGGSPTPPTPYDAEVEYIKSNGQSWIDTGIIASSSISFNLKVKHRKGSDISSAKWIIGARTNTSSYALIESYLNNFRYYGGYGSWSAPNEDYYTFDNTNNPNILNIYDSNDVLINTITANPQVFNTGANIYISTINSYGSPVLNQIFMGETYYVTLYDNGLLVFDGKPVRKDGKGYLYDNVTQQLFGSQTATPYNYGPDIN